MSKQTKTLAQGGLIAALYVVLTLISTALGLSSGAVQVRFSEALCLLPILTPAAIPGLTVGCLVANILSGSILWDVIFGSLATLLGALGTYALRHRHPVLAALPPILSNVIIVPLVLAYAYHIDTAIPLMMLTVGAGEVISVGILGLLLLAALRRTGADRRIESAA